jgi:hypothetical protein
VPTSKQRGQAAFGFDRSCGGAGHAAEELEQGALACAILADDAQHFALLYFQVDVAQGGD